VSDRSVAPAIIQVNLHAKTLSTIVHQFLADLTITVALMLQCCVCLSSATYVLWLNGAS